MNGENAKECGAIKNLTNLIIFFNSMSKAHQR